MVHGVGSKDRQAGTVKEEAVVQSEVVVLPTSGLVHRHLQILGKKLLMIERHLISHDKVCCPGQLIG